MKKHLLCLGLALLPGLALAAPDRLERDLGQGLAYCRVHVLPADLPAAPAKPGALVLDLRYASGDDRAAAALVAWLKFRSSAAAPVFVLLNADTAPAVLGWFTSHEPPVGLVTLGAASPRLDTDLVLKISPAAERAAYDALEHGTPVANLLTDNSVKPRHDEASIAQERTGSPEDTTGDSDPAETAEPKPSTPAVPPPVIDYVLLRAVHLHRALLALKHL